MLSEFLLMPYWHDIVSVNTSIFILLCYFYYVWFLSAVFRGSL